MMLLVWMIFGLLAILALALIDFSYCHCCTSRNCIMLRIVQNHYVINEHLLSTYAIVIFVMLWAGFAIALVVNREWLDLLWNWVRALPSVVEIIVWVVFLPIMAGLWVWESSWPVLVRLLAFAGIIVWTLLAVSSFLRAVR